jgi:phosphatidylglycerol---prolipoprotein diacylglyceryl transferase
VIFVVLWRLPERIALRRLFALYLVLAGAERLLVEFIRRNEEAVLGLSQPQLFAVAMLPSGRGRASCRPGSSARSGGLEPPGR